MCQDIQVFVENMASADWITRSLFTIQFRFLSAVLVVIWKRRISLMALSLGLLQCHSGRVPWVQGCYLWLFKAYLRLNLTYIQTAKTANKDTVDQLLYFCTSAILLCMFTLRCPCPSLSEERARCVFMQSLKWILDISLVKCPSQVLQVAGLILGLAKPNTCEHIMVPVYCTDWCSVCTAQQSSLIRSW